MRKAKELIGKAVINEVTGEQVATVRDLLFDTEARAIVAILVDSSWSPDARVVPWHTVTSVGDVVLIHSETPISIASTEPELADQTTQDVQDIRVTDTPIISATGERIGTVGALFIDEQGEVIGYEVSQGFLSSLSGHKFLPAEQVQAVGKDAVIADTSDLKPVSEVQHDQTESSPQVEEHTKRGAQGSEKGGGE